MLSVGWRLRRQKDIKAVYANGKKTYTPLVRIIVLPTQLNASRAAVVVPKSVSNKAVNRNKIKRRLRSSLREQLPRFNASYDIIVIAQAAALNKTQTELGKTLETIFTKQRLYGSR